jgi:NAD(P)-dependent dehydrogenase (short-subunit alcohol dehydrogenase family)
MELRPTALVTGAAVRIGRGIALRLAAEGFAVAIHYHRSRLEAEALAEEIEATGGRARLLECDLRDLGAASALVSEASGALGPVGLLVNNASVFHDDTATAPDWDLWDAHFDLHLKAPVALAGALARSLPDGRSGLVVNMIDQRVLKLTPQFFSYTLSKSALWTATETLAQALAPRIRVNAIGPGPTLANQRQRPADFEAQSRALLLGRGPSPDEIADAILYLWRAPSVTGQLIAVDGGQHLAWQTPDVTGMRE